MSFMSRAGAFAATVAFCFGLSAACASPADIEALYKEKSVNVVVGYGPGGGYDRFARLLARHLGSHIPGNLQQAFAHTVNDPAFRAEAKHLKVDLTPADAAETFAAVEAPLGKSPPELRERLRKILYSAAKK